MTEAIVEQTPSDLAPSADFAGDETPYLLDTALEISAVLRDLVRTGALASVRFDASPDTWLTPLLSIDVAAAQIILDLSGSEEMNGCLLHAQELLFHSDQRKVKIRFATGPARRVQHDGYEAFAVPFPKSLLRLQRREFYRVPVPSAQPPRCIIALAQDAIRHVEARVIDMSEGGVAVLARPGDLPPELGAQYANCRIVLPESGNLIVTLQSASMHEQTSSDGKAVVRAGFRFVRPSTSAVALLQRYMTKLEQKNRARD